MRGANVARWLDAVVEASLDEVGMPILHAGEPLEEVVMRQLRREADSEPTGDEAPVRNLVVRWRPRKDLTTYLRQVASNQIDQGDKSTQGQWLYRFYLKRDNRPLYVGKAGPREDKGVYGRIKAHWNAATRLGLPTGSMDSLAARNAAALHRRTPLADLKKRRRGDSRVLHEIMGAHGLQSIDVMIGDVLETKPNVRVPAAARKGANLLAERRAIFSGHARINRPDRGDESQRDAHHGS